MAKTQLLAVAATAALLGLVGCRRESYDETTQSSVMSHTVETTPHEQVLPSGWAQTSAAYPTGWADAAERRQAEVDFAAGAGEASVTPPNAIGGGPTDFGE